MAPLNLIVDANVIFASLIKEGKSIEFMLNPIFELYSPDFAYIEILKYGGEIIEKTKRNSDDFVRIFKTLLETVNFREIEIYQDKLNEAYEITPDLDDIDYFALALKLNCPIWSNDKELKKQSKVKIYSTEDLIREFGCKMEER